MTIAPAERAVACEPSLARAIDAALDRAGATERPVMVSLVQPIERQIDPIALLRRARGDERRVLWQQQARGVWAAGFGAAREWAGEGAAPLPALQDEVRRALDEWVVADGSRSDVLLFGGCAFDPARPSAAEWAAFPGALLVAPRLAAANVGGRARMVLTHPVAPDDDFDAVAAAFDELRREASGALADDAPVEPGRTPTVLQRTALPPEPRWKQLVATAAADVRAGRFDKIVLARAEVVAAASEIDPPAALARMRADNPGTTLYALGGEATFVGASPEMLVRVRDGAFATVPLAGSIGRGATPAEDERRATALLASGKDRHEHEVVVGAVLQALDPVAAELAPVPSAPEVRPSRTVLHLATPIHGAVRPGVGALELVARLHPTPAVGGFPTEAAVAAIGAREPFDRGWYAGAFGWINGAEEGEFVVAIRSALVAGDGATLYAGCGIMRDSDPELEYEETRLKLRAVGTALGLA